MMVIEGKQASGQSRVELPENRSLIPLGSFRCKNRTSTNFVRRWRRLEEPRSNPRTLRQQSSLWTTRSVRCLPPFHLVPLLVLWKCKAFFNGCGKMRQLIEINCPQGCRRSATGLDRHRRSPFETARSTGSRTCVCRTDASFRRERIPGDCAQVALADRPDGVNLGLH